MPRISDGQGHELQLGSNTSLPVSSTTIEALLGALNSTAVIDPTASGSEIALLKGIIKQLQGDGTAGKSAPVSIVGSLANITGAVQNVTTAGIRVQLPNIPCREVTIIAKRTNAGYVYAGGNNVSSTVFGVELSAKESYTFAVANANQVYIDTSISGEGISYVAI